MTSWKEDTWRSLAASKFGPICHGACVPRFMAARHFFRIAINSRNTRGKEEGSKSYQTSWRERLSLLLMSLIHFLTKLWVGVATFLSSLPGHILRDIPNLMKHWKPSCHRLLKLYKCRPIWLGSTGTTPFNIHLKIEASCVLFLTQPVCMVPNQNKRNLYL